MDNKKDLKTALGALAFIGCAIGNLAHLFFTIITIVEQIQTGWGFGTDLEMFVLYPWFIELLICLPAIAVYIVYILIFPNKPFLKWLLVSDTLLFGAIIIQILITNVFIFM